MGVSSGAHSPGSDVSRPGVGFPNGHAVDRQGAPANPKSHALETGVVPHADGFAAVPMDGLPTCMNHPSHEGGGESEQGARFSVGKVNFHEESMSGCRDRGDERS